MVSQSLRASVRRAEHSARVVLGDLNRRMDPQWLRRRRLAIEGTPAVIVGVYRFRNATLVSDLLHPRGTEWDVRLWALDEPAIGLQEETVGVGPGAKFHLVDQLLKGVDLVGRTVVVIDDDIAFQRGTLARFLGVMDEAQLDIAQPAHSRRSHANYRIVRMAPRSTARLTTFVEIGPIFAFSPRAHPHLLPFGPEAGMGWGLERFWQVVAGRLNLRMGVVDEVLLDHLVPAASEYDWKQAHRNADQFLDHKQIDEHETEQAVLERWPVWRSTPPWR